MAYGIKHKSMLLSWANYQVYLVQTNPNQQLCFAC